MQFLNLDFTTTKVSDGLSRSDVSGSTTEGAQEAPTSVLKSDDGQTISGTDCFETVFLHFGNPDAGQKEGLTENVTIQLQEKTRSNMNAALGKPLWNMRSILLRGDEASGSVDAFVSDTSERSLPDLTPETELAVQASEGQESILPLAIMTVGNFREPTVPLMVAAGLDVPASSQALTSQADWTFEDGEIEDTALFSQRASEALGQSAIHLNEAGLDHFETKVDTPERATGPTTDVSPDFGSVFQMERLTSATQKTLISPGDSGPVSGDDAIIAENSGRDTKASLKESRSLPQMTHENLGTLLPFSEEGDGVSTMTTDFRRVSSDGSSSLSEEQVSETAPIPPRLEATPLKEVNEGRSETVGQTRPTENADGLKQVVMPMKASELLPANGFPTTVFEGTPSAVGKHETVDVAPKVNDGATFRTSENENNRLIAGLAPTRPNSNTVNPIHPDGTSGEADQIKPENAKSGEVSVVKTPLNDPLTDAPAVNMSGIQDIASDTKDLLSHADEVLSGVTPTRDHGATRDLTSPTSAANRVELPTRVALQIADVARQLPDRPVEITLTPEELGKVRLSFHISENGPMQVVIAAERPETLDLLRRNIDSLIGEFKDLGYADSGFSFQSFDQGGQEEKTSTFSGLGAARSDAVDEPPIFESPTPVRLSLGNSSGMDLRL